MTNQKAIDVLKIMLWKHECNSSFIDFDSEDEDEVQMAEDWTNEKEALEAGIMALKLIDRM